MKINLPANIKRLLITTWALFAFTAATAWASQSPCATTLDGAPNETDFELELSVTQRAMSYVDDLLTAGLLTDGHLQKWILSHENGSPHDLIKTSDTLSNPDLGLHQDSLRSLMEDLEFEPESFVRWSKARVDQSQKDAVRQSETRTQVEWDRFTAIEFAMIPSGRFKSGRLGEVDVTIPYSYGYQKTHMTQWQFAKLMGYNPSHDHHSRLAPGLKTKNWIDVLVDGNVIRLQDDYPVKYAQFAEALQLVERLNELAHNNDPKIYDIIPGHQRGWAYRLPGKYEMEYPLVVRDGYSSDRYFFSKSLSYRLKAVRKALDLMGSKSRLWTESQNEEALTYGWFKTNSGGTLHPVGQLRPWLINGHEIFDPVGNVAIWTQELAPHKRGEQNLPLRIQLDPTTGLEIGSVPCPTSRCWVGSHYKDRLEMATYFEPDTDKYDSPDVGIRLVTFKEKP